MHSGFLTFLASESAPRRIHLLGVGGCGMSGLAHLFLDMGCEVSGSDQKWNPSMDALVRRGAQLREGHDPAWLNEVDPSWVIASTAIRDSNPEWAQVLVNGIPHLRRGEALAAVASLGRPVCVAGMHGKTTTSAMLTVALQALGVSASHAIGGQVEGLGAPASWTGSNDPFVLEADESDGTLDAYHPESAILLNVDEEHMAHFGNRMAIIEAFSRFISRVRGAVVYWSGDADLHSLLHGNVQAVSVGPDLAAHYQFRRRPGLVGGLNQFNLSRSDGWSEVFEVSCIGEKNAQNAAVVAAWLLEQGHSAEKVRMALRRFQGVGRRQERVAEHSGIRFFQDYGHHPNEIGPTLEAFREVVQGRLVAVFEPHRFTRTRDCMEGFSRCFRPADLVRVLPVYPAGEDPIEGVDHLSLGRAIADQGTVVQTLKDREDLRQSLFQDLQDGDVVVFFGAGPIGQTSQEMGRELIERMNETLEQHHDALTQAAGEATEVRLNEPLARKTTLRVGGMADFYAEPDSIETLRRLVGVCRERGIPFRVLGRGSNLLVRDGGFRGLILSLQSLSFSQIRLENGRLICGAGAKLKAVAVAARREGIGGMEFFEGIPGSVGGALRMNAGAMGSWTFSVVESFTCLDPEGNLHHLTPDNIQVEYRNCPILKDHIALEAVLCGRPEEPDVIKARMEACNKKRWESQPNAPSAGCMFKNPESIPAGRLIDELGLKGTAIGGARISDIHGNFIVNEGGATAADVLNLIEFVRNRALEARGIQLHSEVEIIGEESRPPTQEPTPI